MKFSKMTAFTLGLCTLSNSLFSDETSKVCGKVDVAPVYVHIDLLTEGKTVEKMDIFGGRADLCYAIWGGVTLKPTITYGYNNQELFMTGLGIGHITPVTKWLTVTPVVGMSYTYLDTDATIEVPFFGKFDHVKRTFTSYAPYLGLELTFNICSDTRIYAQYQYAWTRNRTTLSDKHLPDFVPTRFKESSQGSAYGFSIEKDLNAYWSINAGGAYNNSTSKEKNGTRAYGFKVGIARWF